jgi:hypothetical protein
LVTVTNFADALPEYEQFAERKSLWCTPIPDSKFRGDLTDEEWYTTGYPFVGWLSCGRPGEIGGVLDQLPSLIVPEIGNGRGRFLDVSSGRKEAQGMPPEEKRTGRT